jgi:ABC-type dipeptide/oligopeptide/nickel transport system ATPase component/ABC-type dipeptide/oligopeptide/nickel transport system permease subunit
MSSITSRPAKERGRGTVLTRFLRNPLGAIGVLILLVAVIGAAMAPLLAPAGPSAAEIANTFAGPSGSNLLGTDSAGRDTFGRLLWAGQLTLLSALLCAVVAIAIGLPAGLIAGFYGGPFDGVSSWMANALMSLPAIIVLLSVRSAVGPSVWLTMIIFGILLSPGYYRLTRTAVQSVRNELYVDAARVSGLSDTRIIGRHIMSVVRAPIIIQTALIAGVAIAIQSGLEFLGLGDPQEPTWGAMLSEGFRNIYIEPLLMLWPALAIGLTVGAFVLIGNALRDALEDLPSVRANRKAAAAVAASGVSMSAMAEPITAGIPTDVTLEEPPTMAIGTMGDPLPGTDTVPPGEHLLTVRDLEIGYANSEGDLTSVVKGVTFHIDRGEVLSIVGESGSGKSQTAFAVLGLLPSSAHVVGGSITIDDLQTVDAAAERIDQSAIRTLRGSRISYIPQEPMANLDPNYTIGHQLSRPMVKLLGIGRPEAKRRALALLERVGITDPQRTFDSYPHQISGGMAQRVLIAGAVSCEPDLIIADEPTTALDVTVQAEVLDLLRGMRDELGVAILLVTHNFGVVADIADRVAVMQRGRLVEEGSVREILRDPAHPYTRTLLASTLTGRQPLTMLTQESGR